MPMMPAIASPIAPPGLNQYGITQMPMATPGQGFNEFSSSGQVQAPISPWANGSSPPSIGTRVQGPSVNPSGGGVTSMPSRPGPGMDPNSVQGGYSVGMAHPAVQQAMQAVMAHPAVQALMRHHIMQNMR